MTQLIIATRNKKKLKDLKHLLCKLPLKVMDLDEAEKAFKVRVPNVKEDKSTFAGNAVKKAIQTSRFFPDAIVIADDSGLCVKCLNGKPGINSARFAGQEQDDAKNNVKLLKAMNKAGKNRDAYFSSTIAIAKNFKIISLVDGRVYGRILTEQKGKEGFGYDPLFVPRGYKKTFGQMSHSFKNRISHRAKALKKAKEVLISIVVN